MRDLQHSARDYYCQLPAHLATLTGPDFAREVRFPRSDSLEELLGKARPATGAESLLQFVMRSTYHRGQVARRLRELRVESPITD